MMRWSVALAFVVSCSPWLETAPAPAPPASSEAFDTGDAPPQPVRRVATPTDDRLALFDSLVAEVHAVHQFSPNTWENLAPLTFDRATSSIRQAFVEAATDADLTAALVRFGNALHDAHVGFQPASPPHAHLTLPIVLTPEWDGDDVSMVVTATKAKGVDAGDIVTSYAGTPADGLLWNYADRASGNQWRSIALGVAEWMTERPADSGDGIDGGTVTLGLRKRDGSDAFVNVTWSRGGWHGDEEADGDSPQYERTRCAPGLPGRHYPTYQLASHGTAYCLYLSKVPRYAAFPVVRFFSFDFRTPFDAEAEHENLSRALRSLAGVRGLVLDLRDNGGGSDPRWVLDWFAVKPYLDLRTQVRKPPPVDTFVLDDVANLDDGWLAALARAPEGSVIAMPSGCSGATCAEARQRPMHRVLPVPVSLLVGPRCNGACDHFARVWDENGLGPIVGEPTGAALTALRFDYPVVTLGGKRLGSLRLALSLDYSPFTGLPVEGLPIHVDVPVAWSWAKRDVYDARMVDGAIGALSK
jgi:hypothetical protein